MANSFPDFKGRIPSGTGLPKLGGGQGLKPSHISGLATGIDKATIRSGKGYTVSSQGSGGTTLQIKQSGGSFPWACTPHRGGIYVTIGNCWGMGVAKRRKNTWKHKNRNYADSETIYSARPVLIDIEGNDFTSTEYINDDDPLILAKKVGYYYIEWCEYKGETGTSELTSTLVGSMQFVMKFSAQDPQAGDRWFLLCYVDNELTVFQGVQSDIFMDNGSGDSHAWKIKIVRQDEQDWICVDYGEINNFPAKYSDGTALGDDVNGGFSAGVGTVNVYLMVSGDEEAFPTDAKVYSGSGDVPQATDSNAYVNLGRVKGEKKGTGASATTQYTITQLVNNSLWGERFKPSSNKPAIYWFTGL
jgi:hypothetical protein